MVIIVAGGTRRQTDEVRARAKKLFWEARDNNDLAYVWNLKISVYKVLIREWECDADDMADGGR